MPSPRGAKTKVSSIQVNRVETKNIKEAHDALMRMYNGLEKSNPLVKYLEDHCLPFLTSTEKLVVLGSDKTLSSSYASYPVKSRVKVGMPLDYKGKSGLYLFVNTNTDQQYIGSAICLYTRYKAHMVNSTRPSRGGDNPLYTSIRIYGANCFT